MAEERLRVGFTLNGEAVAVDVPARRTLADAIRDDGGEVLSVRVWESPTAFGGYTEALR